jgi:hypothetical protein
MHSLLKVIEAHAALTQAIAAAGSVMIAAAALIMAMIPNLMSSMDAIRNAHTVPYFQGPGDCRVKI